MLSAEQSGIVFNDATGNNHSLTAGNTNITGGVIANVSQNANVSKEKGEHCSSLAQGEGCARETGTLMVGANSTTVTGVEDTHTVAHYDKTETTTVGLAVRNAY